MTFDLLNKIMVGQEHMNFPRVICDVTALNNKRKRIFMNNHNGKIFRNKKK